MWWTNWYWDRLFSQFFCFLLLIIFHHSSISTLVSSGDWTMDPVVGAVL
jgi:hypothetical protein